MAKGGAIIVIRPNRGPPRPMCERQRNDTPKKQILRGRLVPGRDFAENLAVLNCASELMTLSLEELFFQFIFLLTGGQKNDTGNIRRH